VLFALKLVVSTVLIVWIVRAEDVPEVLGALAGADPALVSLAFLTYASTYLIRALRWCLLLGAGGINAPIPFLIRSYLVSVFFSNFLPSTVGGDVVRVYDSWKIGATKTGALTVIFVDRFLGVVALLVFASGALLLSGAARSIVPFIMPLALVGTLVSVGGLWLIFDPPGVVLRWVTALRKGGGARLERWTEPLFNALATFQGQRRVAGLTLAHSLVFQAMIILHYLIIARALGIGIPAGDFFWIIPIAILVMMVPISINAIGLREHVFVFFFAAYAIPGSAALAFAWISYGIVLMLGVIGGILTAIRR
jgi:glycosyltransferase 2 family protein